MKRNNPESDLKRRVRRQYRATIKKLIRKVGFAVKNIQVGIDWKSDPNAGFIVKVVGEDTPYNRSRVELALNNFAYNISFVKA